MPDYSIMRQIYADLRLRGGQGELHACYFPRMTLSEYTSALAALRASGALIRVGPCLYELGASL